MREPKLGVIERRHTIDDGCSQRARFYRGNLDKEGGTLVGRGVIDFPKFGVKNGLLMRTDRSRIGNFQSVNDA